MSLIKCTIDDNTQVINLENINVESHVNKIKLFNDIDELLLSINKNKYENAKEIIKYIKSIRSPQQISKLKITLLSLMNFFQKTYVTNTFKVNLSKIPENIRVKLDWQSVNIISKINNFPHLIGISGLRDIQGNIISRAKPREFLDGVLYQFILLHSHADYILDSEKLEVFPWMHQTLSNPTYILDSSAINPEGTKFHADLIFIRRIFNSDKYIFHIIGLKNESGTNFTFKSQFAITRDRQYRLKKMFDLDKAIFDFYKRKRESVPISSGQAGSTYQKISRDH